MVLAGVLPAWDECSSEGQKGPEKECAAALNAGVDVAVRTLQEWHQCARPGITFAGARRVHRGLMQLTL